MEITRVHDISVLHLFGEVSLMEFDQIEKILVSLKRSCHHKVILDLTSVDHIHYQVLRRLVDEAREMRRCAGDIKLVMPSLEMREIMRFVGADQYLEDYASISEGILSFLKYSTGPEIFSVH